MNLESDQKNIFFDSGEETSDSPRLIIEKASTENIINALKNPQNTEFRRTWFPYNKYDPDDKHPLGQWSTATSQDNPAVIYDDGAAFCSPVLVFDKQGNALHFHDSLIAWRRSPEYGNCAKTYFDELPNFVSNNEVIACISGTNVHIAEAYRELGIENPIDQVINYVKQKITDQFPNAQFLSFVSKQYENQQSGLIVPDNTQVRGMTYIPPYLSKDGNAYLMPVFDEESIEIDRVFNIHPGARI